MLSNCHNLLTNIYHRPLRCKVLEGKGCMKPRWLPDLTVWSHGQSVFIAKGKCSMHEGGVSSSLEKAVMYIIPKPRTLEFHNLVRPHPVILQIGSGVSEFIIFPIASINSRRIQTQEFLHVLMSFGLRCSSSESGGNRHLKPGALKAGKRFKSLSWLHSKNIFSNNFLTKKFLRTGNFETDTLKLTWLQQQVNKRWRDSWFDRRFTQVSLKMDKCWGINLSVFSDFRIDCYNELRGCIQRTFFCVDVCKSIKRQ